MNFDYDIDAVPSIATGLAGVTAQNNVATAVLAKTLDNMDASGTELARMIERSVTPGLGENIDVRV